MREQRLRGLVQHPTSNQSAEVQAAQLEAGAQVGHPHLLVQRLVLFADERNLLSDYKIYK